MGKVRKKSKQFKHINSARLENFESLSSSISSLESKIAKLINVLEKIDRASAFEQSIRNRAKNEQELGLTEQSLSSDNKRSNKGFNGTTMQKVMGRNRELLTLLINEGFHTYAEISKKMDISESRARAYVTELKKNFNIPIKQIRDSEGYKIGIDISFVDRILSAAKVE